MANGGEFTRQHKNMAMGKGLMASGNHGCEPLASVQGNKTHPDQSNSHTPMGDHQRSGPPHIHRGNVMMPATAHSDHGPHQGDVMP